MNSIPIIFQNDDILVINKPAGIIVHTDGRSEGETILDLFPGTIAVHRLDRDTSGVLILAKNEQAAEFLKAQFHDRKVKKTYRAIAYGYMKDNEGEVDASIARKKSDPRMWSAQRGKKGKEREAITLYKVLKRFETPEGRFTYVEFYPKTGRTHQIRVHAKYLSHPIVADSLYAGKLFEEGAKPLGFSRQALHAYSLTLALSEGVEKTFVAPLPKEFEGATV